VLLYLLLTMAVTAAVTLWVTFQVELEDRLLVASASSALSLALCIALAFTTLRARRARRTAARLRALENGLVRLVDDVLPRAAARVRGGASADTVLAELSAAATADVPKKLLGAVVREIGVSERQRAATMAACANAAGRVQAMATSMLADLREMEGRHAENVLGDLLKIDHSTAQTGRLADSIAVLTGARSGRRWTKPIVMESILRGAMGRIQAYQRVQVHSNSTAAVVGYAAEDVMHSLAELMDNATRFSAPSEEVHVYVEELHTGVVVTIEDGGLGMKPQALARAEAAVSTDRPLDLAKVPGTRLGLVVVGSLARKHKLQVYFRPSSRGGTGVVMRIPQQLVIHPREAEPAATAPRTLESVRAAGGSAVSSSATTTAVLEPVPPPPPDEPAAKNTVEETIEEDTTEVPTLPKRPRGETFAAAVRATEAKREPAPRGEKKTDIGARFSAFQQGRRNTTPDQNAGGGDSL
jgi:signal transduction histidine kinase